MVPGEGPVPARGMIVGEAPGRQEVVVGRPFVGAAGRLLDSALAALGVPREDVYITNVIKDLPLDSLGKIRRPDAEEIQEWSATLEEEIRIVSPQAILLLGRTAVDHVYPVLEGIGFGEAWTVRTSINNPETAINLYTAYHPAYILRDLGRYSRWINQLKPWADALQG